MARLAPEAGLPQPRPSPQPVFRPVENVLHTTRWNSFRFPKNRSTGSRAACTSQSSRRCRIFRPESVLFGVGPARSVVGTPRPKRTAWPPGTNAGSSSRRRPTHVPRTASIRTASSAAGLSRRAAVHPLPEHLTRAFTDAFNRGAVKLFPENVENARSSVFDSLRAGPAYPCAVVAHDHRHGGRFATANWAPQQQQDRRLPPVRAL